MSTELSRLHALNGTPYPDTLEVANRILETTRTRFGGYFNPQTGETFNVERGYIIGGAQEGTVFPRDAADGAKRIAKILQRIPRNIHGHSIYSVETFVWEDEIHIVVFDIAFDLPTALSLAKAWKQKEFCDVEGYDCITIHDDGTHSWLGEDDDRRPYR